MYLEMQHGEVTMNATQKRCTAGSCLQCMGSAVLLMSQTKPDCATAVSCVVCVFRPLSKTVRFNVLRVIPAGSGGDKKGFSGF